MIETAAKIFQIEVDQDVLQGDDFKVLVEGVKNHPSELADFARYLDMVEDRKEFYQVMAERSPLALIEMYISWKKEQEEPPAMLARDKPARPDRVGILAESRRRFVAKAADLWAAEGGSVGVPEFVERMVSAGNPSKEKSLSTIIRACLNKKQLIGTRQNTGGNSPWRIPVWQIDSSTGAFYAEIAPVCEVIGDNGFAALEFMLAERVPGLNARPLDYLGKGEVSRLLSAARAYFDRLEM